MPARKKKAQDPEPESEEEQEPVDDGEGEGEGGGGDDAGDVSDDGEEGQPAKKSRASKKMTPEQKEKNRASRRRSVAKRKGYRLRATKAGYAAGKASAMGASRDVASNVVTIAETIRACKWAPKMRGSPAYADIDEFEERTALSVVEALPPGAATVIRGSGEAFLRRVVDEAVLRSFEAGRPRVTTATLYSVLRPMMGALRFTVGMPQGLVRYAQTKTINAGGVDANAIGFFDEDSTAVREEAKMLPKQEAIGKEIEAKAAEKKKKRADKRAAGGEEGAGKRAKTRAAAA